MKPTLKDWLGFSPSQITDNLNTLAQDNLAAAFDGAVILAKNVRRNGERMPIIVDFIAAQFPQIERVHSGLGTEFSALSVVGDYKSGAEELRARAAALFKKKIEGLAMLDTDKARSIALNVKASGYDDNPVRAQAVQFLIRMSSFDELSDLARHAQNMNEDEQMAFLERVDSFTEQFPGGVNRLIDGFQNRVGLGVGPVSQKAEEIFDRSKAFVGPVLALIGADTDEVRYISEGDEPDIVVPLNKTLN